VTEIALRRILFRVRRRRPSLWAVLTVCNLALVLAHLGVDIAKMARGDWWRVLLIPCWIALYWAWMWVRRQAFAAEERGALAPPWRVQWGLLALNAMLLVLEVVDG
jgi:hypothetical protein